MVFHRAHAQFDRARWRVPLLIAIWTLQALLAMAILGIFAWRLSETLQTWKEEEEKGGFPTVGVVWESTNMGLSVLSLSLIAYEIWRLVAETLTPWTMLFTHSLKLTCSLGVLALDIFVYVRRKDGHYSLIGLALDGAFILAVLFPAVYAIRTYRRLSAYDEISYASNVKPYGFNSDDLERDTSYSSRFSLPFDNAERRRSSASTLSRRSSSDPVPLQDVSRTPSVYNHERDTQFDDYMAARNSQYIGETVERAMGQEFGWVTGPTEDLSRRSSIISSGMVPSAKRGQTLGRIPSYESAHVLLSVPEADEDEPAVVGRSTSEPEDDREALLTRHARQGSGDSGKLAPIEEADPAAGPSAQRKRKWDS